MTFRMKFGLTLLGILDFVSLSRQWQNEYDENLLVECPDRYGFYKVLSQHANWAEDRQWQWDCREVSIASFEHCYWTEYVNDWDDPLYTQCFPDYILTGVSSYHSNYKEDRKWRLKCCKAEKYFTRNCEVTSYINYYDSFMNYTVTPPAQVFTGLFSAHVNYYEDRVWAIQICEYYSCSGTGTCGSNGSVCDQIAQGGAGGSSLCSCYSGYVLQDDNKSCTDIDECSSGNGGCSDICINTPGSFHCFCALGYSLESDGLTCSDIDECEDPVVSVCAQNCQNTAGSYQCSCGSGYLLQDDGHSCKDIDECADGTSHCIHKCINTAGSFLCGCEDGYHLDKAGLNCTDVDECVDSNNNGGCEQLCTNTAGSYSCSCSAGYVLHDNKMNCTDINECQINNGSCEHLCINTEGSYVCECLKGYQWKKDALECIDINECDEGNGGCEQNCVNTDGGFYCSCMDGYEISRDVFCSASSKGSSSGLIKGIYIFPIVLLVAMVVCALSVTVTVLIMKRRAKKTSVMFHAAHGLYHEDSDDDDDDDLPLLNCERDADTVPMMSNNARKLDEDAKN